MIRLKQGEHVVGVERIDEPDEVVVATDDAGESAGESAEEE